MARNTCASKKILQFLFNLQDGKRFMNWFYFGLHSQTLYSVFVPDFIYHKFFRPFLFQFCPNYFTFSKKENEKFLFWSYSQLFWFHSSVLLRVLANCLQNIQYIDGCYWRTQTLECQRVTVWILKTKAIFL